MLQLNTLVRFIHSHSPARLSKFKKILARRPKSVPTPELQRENTISTKNNVHQSRLSNCAILYGNYIFPQSNY